MKHAEINTNDITDDAEMLRSVNKIRKDKLDEDVDEERNPDWNLLAIVHILQTSAYIFSAHKQKFKRTLVLFVCVHFKFNFKIMTTFSLFFVHI